MIKLAANDLREGKPTKEEIASVKRNPIYIIVENVLDTYNTGAIFRLADAAAASGVYLVGDTAVPTDKKVGHKIHKASVGVWQWVPWKKTETVELAVEDIKKKHNNLQVIAIEQSPKSVSYKAFDYRFPLAFILGHETTGISKEALELSDAIVEIPMFGVNKSLNVMVSLAIVLWKSLEKDKSFAWYNALEKSK